MTPGERKRFEARYSRWAAAFYITFALAMTAVLAMMLSGCAEAHALPPADAGTCAEPHPDCFEFLTDHDRAIRWLPRTDCTERPMRERYAMRPIWPEPEGTLCGNGGTCGTWGVCEGGAT